MTYIKGIKGNSFYGDLLIHTFEQMREYWFENTYQIDEVTGFRIYRRNI